MDLIAAILHVHEAAVLAIEQLRISLAAPVLATLLEDIVVFAIASKYSGVALALHEVGIFLHDRLEVNAEICVLLHRNKYFLYTKKFLYEHIITI